jgi:uncharacterized protein (TIGR00730 family)
MIRSVCVYAASSQAVGPEYVAAADTLGALLAQHRLTLVYGGGKIGLMGALARSVHEHGGRVIGVIPHYLRTVELAYEAADELIVTSGLREREAAMEERADAFVAMPGGFGTLEEVLEVLTLKQLGQHTKPVVFLNTSEFWQPLLQMFERFIAQHFARPESRLLYQVVAEPAEVLTHLQDCL